MRARALVLVPRGPVRALARLAAVSRPVYARDEQVPAAPAIGERSLRERTRRPAVGARPLFEHNRAELRLLFFDPREGGLSLGLSRCRCEIESLELTFTEMRARMSPLRQ